jgi:peptidoglycan/LPS O-acetylase OafA/YrhL
LKPGETTKTRERAPGLDGVRALAVLTVIGFHEGASGLRGGFLGVDIFFVLSGFLITDLLIAGYDRAGRLNLADFWTRRARRLLPALAVMLVVVTAAAAVIEPAQEGSLRLALLAAATYTSNWYQILHHVSYFAAISQAGAPPPFDHLWSLAIEEQFYLVWPLIVLCVIVRLDARRARVICALTGAAVSALIMVIQYTPGGDPSAVYYGTDTHASALLIGAALALAWPLRRLAAIPAAHARRLDMAGIAGLVVLAWAVGHFSGGDQVVYPVGLLVAALAAAGLIAAAAGHGVIAALTSLQPLRWVGVRSYGIYLWHWPVIALGTALAGRTLVVASRDGCHDRPGVGLVAVHRDTHHAERPGCHRPALDTAHRRGQPSAASEPGTTRRPGHDGGGRDDHLRAGLLRRGPATRGGCPGRAAPPGGQRRAGKQRVPVDSGGSLVLVRPVTGRPRPGPGRGHPPAAARDVPARAAAGLR